MWVTTDLVRKPWFNAGNYYGGEQGRGGWATVTQLARKRNQCLSTNPRKSWILDAVVSFFAKRRPERQREYSDWAISESFLQLVNGTQWVDRLEQSNAPSIPGFCLHQCCKCPRSLLSVTWGRLGCVLGGEVSFCVIWGEWKIELVLVNCLFDC